MDVTTTAFLKDHHHGRAPSPVAPRRLGRRRRCRRRARGAEKGADRDHRVDRLLVGQPMAHELGASSEIRHRVTDDLGKESLVGGDPRPPHARREPGDAHAARHPLRVDDGAAGLAGEADDHPACYLNRNGQAITLTKALLDKGVKTPQQTQAAGRWRPRPKGSAADLRHDAIRRARTRCGCATGWPPAASTRTRTSRSSPSRRPQMVANMKVGKMDGFCVGEPWNARAIADGIGFTAITTQQIWKDHPEKVLAFTEEFADEEPEDGRRPSLRARHRGQPVDRQAREPRRSWPRSCRQPAVHQLRRRRSSSAACSATTTTATAARRRTSTT